MIIPFLDVSGGNCQDAVILVEEDAVRLKPLGGFEGTAIRKIHYVRIIIIIIIAITYLLYNVDIISSSPFPHHEAEIFYGVQLCKYAKKTCHFVHDLTC